VITDNVVIMNLWS